MNRHIVWLAVSLLLCFYAAAVPAHADPVYSYAITIPSLDSTAPGATFSLDWIGAPLNPHGIGYGMNAVLSGSPLDGYAPASATWTSTIANLPVEGAPLDSEIMLQFFGTDSQILSFTFIEPDSFWAGIGTDMAFPVGVSVYGLLKFPDFTDGSSMVWGQTQEQEGAFYGDPTACAGCTITVSATSSVPEPASVLLLGGILVAGITRKAWRQRMARG
jgi:hypothetical protein